MYVDIFPNTIQEYEPDPPEQVVIMFAPVVVTPEIPLTGQSWSPTLIAKTLGGDE